MAASGIVSASNCDSSIRTMPSAAGILVGVSCDETKPQVCVETKDFFALLSRFAPCCLPCLSRACFVLLCCYACFVAEPHANFIGSFNTQAELLSRLPSLFHSIIDTRYSCIHSYLTIAISYIFQGPKATSYTLYETPCKSRDTGDSFFLGTHPYISFQEGLANLRFLFPEFYISQHITPNLQILVLSTCSTISNLFCPTKQIIHNG